MIVHGMSSYPQLPDWMISSSESLSSCLKKLMMRIETYVRHRVVSNFHAWYKILPTEKAEKHRNELIKNYNAQQLICEDRPEIDALILKSRSCLRTGNFLVYCLNTTYQNHHPRHFIPFLNNGADVVVWNANFALLTPKNYSKDLHFVLRALRQQNPDRSITVFGHCMVTDPIISAAWSMRDSNIHLIVDRGHGNATSLASALSPLSRIPLIRRILKEDCDCLGIEKVRDITGRILFISAGSGDEMLDYGCGKNFTQDLLRRREHNFDHIVLRGGNHWSPWDYSNYLKVLKFLFQVRVVQQEPFVLDLNSHPLTTPPSYLQRKRIQCVIKCKATLMKL